VRVPFKVVFNLTGFVLPVPGAQAEHQTDSDVGDQEGVEQRVVGLVGDFGGLVCAGGCDFEDGCERQDV